jgi:ribosomal protein S18 acetylase RimI-like enzyme
MTPRLGDAEGADIDLKGRMIVRRAEPSDSVAIAEVRVASWRSAYRGLLPDSLLDALSVHDIASRWKARIEKGRIRVFVCQTETGVVGFVAIGPTRDEGMDDERVGEVCAIYVRPEGWRKGYGSALLCRAIESLREQGRAEVTLWVLRDNERGTRFYEARGFEADGATKVETRDDGVQLHEIRYRRSI